MMQINGHSPYLSVAFRVEVIPKADRRLSGSYCRDHAFARGQAHDYAFAPDCERARGGPAKFLAKASETLTTPELREKQDQDRE